MYERCEEFLKKFLNTTIIAFNKYIIFNNVFLFSYPNFAFNSPITLLTSFIYSKYLYPSLMNNISLYNMLLNMYGIMSGTLSLICSNIDLLFCWFPSKSCFHKKWEYKYCYSIDIFYNDIVVFTVSVIYYLDFDPFNFFTHNAYQRFFFIIWTLYKHKYYGDK